VLRRVWIAHGLIVLLSVAGVAGAASPPRNGGATSRAVALQVIVPGQAGISTTAAAAPKDAVAFGNASAYPDAAGVSWGPSVASASASTAETALASAAAEVSSLTLFGGELTASSVRGQVQASAGADEASGDFTGSAVSDLVVLGQAVAAAPGARVALGDWGYAIVLAQGSGEAPKSYRGNVTALDIRLSTDHGGLPAGTQILVGYAEASVQAPVLPPQPAEPVVPKPPKAPKSTRQGPPEPSAAIPSIRPVPPNLRVKLSPRGYVFPVYGPSSFTNTFGAPRAAVIWHHGEDIFAPLGAPVLAVTRGTVFSVGWNDLGGYRFWLRDEQGNQFYYAHLSAFSPLAVNGRRVRPGDVLGFVGNTGDAQGTPYHLHFEIHPVGMLTMGYDGVIPPYPHLLAWRRVQDIRFATAAGWAPTPAPSATAPKPGAILLQMSDISVASGLRPGSVSRAFAAPVAAEGDGALIRGLGPLAAPSPPSRDGAR
jgi:murein DD-endopeptidase MepM/ murein hydrolase activator NlpD